MWCREEGEKCVEREWKERGREEARPENRVTEKDVTNGLRRFRVSWKYKTG